MIKKSGIKLFEKSMKNTKSFSFSFIIPLYFSVVGLRINLVDHFHMGRFLLFYGISATVVILSVTLFLYLCKVRKNAILNFAVTATAKGGPGIALATIGYEYKIINAEFFTILIITSIISSLIVGFWLRKQNQKGLEFWELLHKI